MTRDDRAHPEIEAEAERLAGAAYGTIARREDASGVQTVLTVLRCVALGGLLVILEVLVH